MGDLFEETKAKLDTTGISFKLHKALSGKSSNTTKTDLDSPLRKVVPKLAKLMTKQLMRPPSQQSIPREKFRSLRKAGFPGFQSQVSGRNEEHIFGDTNIRTEVSVAPTLKRNKIHSLFIEAQREARN
jgi:hypothetical protein